MSAKFRRCFLWALRENRNARDFYSAMGFAEIRNVIHTGIEGECLTDLRYVSPEE